MSETKEQAIARIEAQLSPLADADLSAIREVTGLKAWCAEITDPEGERQETQLARAVLGLVAAVRERDTRIAALEEAARAVIAAWNGEKVARPIAVSVAVSRLGDVLDGAPLADGEVPHA